MGGQALKNANTERKSKEQFINIYCKVVQKLIEEMNIHPIDIRMIDYYRDKSDFGDMDLIISKEYKNDTFLDRLKQVFNPIEVYPNTDVYSFDFEKFQIDLIFIPREYLQIATTYYNYNDLGNLMGRIADKLGVRYGHTGLKFEHYVLNRSAKLATIKLSIDPRQIFEFLGYDFDRYLLGFQNIEEMFEYVVTSKYFNPKYFEYSNLNHQNRTRNKKRKTYEQFLEWLKNTKYSYVYEPTAEKNLQKIFETFPFVKSEIERVEKELRKKDIIGNKFNGNLIKNLIPDINFKRISNIIIEFNKLYDEAYIEKQKQSVINDKILEINARL